MVNHNGNKLSKEVHDMGGWVCVWMGGGANTSPSHKGQRVHWSMALLTKLCASDVRGSNDSWQLCLSIAGDRLMRPSQPWCACRTSPKGPRAEADCVLYTKKKDWPPFVIRLSVSKGIMGKKQQKNNDKQILCYDFFFRLLPSKECSSSTLLFLQPGYLLMISASLVINLWELILQNLMWLRWDITANLVFAVVIILCNEGKKTFLGFIKIFWEQPHCKLNIVKGSSFH